MTDIVVLAEEPSGRIVAENLCEQLGFADRALCLEHEGTSDLERSVPRRIAGWHGPVLPRFVIMRDNDGADCRARKAKLNGLVPALAADRVKVRIVMQELESWYFGDLDAVAKAGLIDAAKLSKHKNAPRLRNPDSIVHAKEEFKRKIAPGGQLELARRIGPHLSLTDNRSVSFRRFVEALKWAAAQRSSP